MPDVYIEDVIAPNYDELLDDVLDHRHSQYLLKGGRGSLKSSFIGFAIPLIMVQPGNEACNAVIFRKTANTLRDSVYSQMVFALDKLGLDSEFICHVSPMSITRKSTGQTILFRGLDDPMKLKSLKFPKGYCAIAWFEEADTFDGMKEIRSVLQSTNRGGSKFWNFMSFNPPITLNNFMNQEALVQRPDRLVHSSTYLTVPPEWLGQMFFDDAELLRQTNPRAYEHEYLGIPTGTGGEVFTNLELREITDAEIASFDYIYEGIDWGWYPDPNHWSKMCYRPSKMTLYIFDELRCNKTPNEVFWQRLQKEKNVTSQDLIIADSAEPKSIADLKAYGASIRPTEKGPDSVRYSMKWLQSLVKIVVDPNRCPETAREFAEYEYERTKDDELTGQYPDKDNHSIDSVRYALNPVWKRRGL